MNSHATPTPDSQSQAIANEAAEKQGIGEETVQLAMAPPTVVTQNKLQAAANNSARVKQLMAFQRRANNRGKVAQLESKEGGSEGADLLELAAELEKSKSKDPSAPVEEIDKAIEALKSAAENAPPEELAKGVEALHAEVDAAKASPSAASSSDKPAQFSGWRFGLGFLGFVLGSVLPVIGNIFGAYIGYRRGRVMDWKNKAAPAAFTPANLVFCSISGGNVGSVYFNGGRIRLTHGGHPEVSEHAGIERYTISNADYHQYVVWKNGAHRSKLQRYNYVTTLASCAVAVAGGGQRLIEFFGANGAGGSHPSRGGPMAFNYAVNQEQVNLMYWAAAEGDNDILRHAMGTDALLSTIPMN